MKLRHLDVWNARRAAVATLYRERLSGLKVGLPHVPNWAEPNWHLFVILKENRLALQRRLSKVGIQTLIHYPKPPHLQHAYVDLGMARGSLPIAERLAEQVLSLPMGPHLGCSRAAEIADHLVNFCDDFRSGNEI